MHFWFLRQDVNRLPAIYNRDLPTRCLFKVMLDFCETRPGYLGQGPFLRGGKVEVRDGAGSGVNDPEGIPPI